ncbi:MAG TPA: putative manganese-dependent inorganic diphosphatase [Solirubrobacteraceae bacterium]|nr:putative manganese-dependent inorganic diphosphatase [Solirubrobacteraceae bacterium]
MPTVYVTGHRNPDTDAVVSAIGYAEFKQRIDGDQEYVPVRLGQLNPQTRWVLEQSEVPEPEFLPHILLRACDVMQTEFPSIDCEAPIRQAGLDMSQANLDVVPVVDDDGSLVGVVTSRALARSYIRESRESSALREATHVKAVVEVLDGELVTGENRQLSGRVWVHSMDVNTKSGISDGDVVVVGNRTDAQRLCLELGAALLVISNSAQPEPEIVSLAKERDAAIIVSPLDTYVSGRMITLAAPCRALMEADPLTCPPDDLLSDVSEQVREVHYGAAVVVDNRRRPIGLVTRSDLVDPPRRQVLLVDHAEQAQSVPGVEHAEIVEILDHHHIGSIETHVPVLATFDPVGSTSTLVVERFRQNGMEPGRQTAKALLGAILSDTVILNSPTATERDRAVVSYLERVLGLDARQFGREMFEATSDVSAVGAQEIVSQDAKSYQTVGGQQICIAQIEVVGDGLMERKSELLEAMEEERRREDKHVYALMVTDVLDKNTQLLVAGEVAPVARAFGKEAEDSVIDLPDVMSRKKQVAPKLLQAL